MSSFIRLTVKESRVLQAFSYLTCMEIMIVFYNNIKLNNTH